MLDFAHDGAEVQAVVAVHGDLKTPMPAAMGDIKGRVLIIHGAPDPVVPMAARDANESVLDAAWGHAGCTCSSVCCMPARIRAPTTGIAGYDAAGSRQTCALMHAFNADAFAGAL